MGGISKSQLLALGIALVGWVGPAVAKAGQCSLPAFVLPVAMQGFRATIPVEVNGKKTTFLLDSGAWFSIMSQAKAQELGLHLKDAPVGFTLSGIGGSFEPQIARIRDFAINGSILHNVDFFVGGSDVGAAAIGRNLFASYDTEFDIGHGKMALIRPKGDCAHANMAYWTKGQPPFTVKLLHEYGDDQIKDFLIPVLLNGKQVTAEIDSGATTLISSTAAKRAGIDLSAPGVTPIDSISGFGQHWAKAWSVRLKSVSIGDETILNPRLTVIDGPIVVGSDAPDMLLGIGFLLSHHLYVSRAQHLIYFTYNGGKPFIDDQPEDHVAPPGSIPATAIPAGKHLVKPLDTAKSPESADDFARQGALMLTQDHAAQAIKDYSEAIRLAPQNAHYYYRRGIAQRVAGDDKAELADLQKAATLKPDDADIMLDLAYAYHANGDEAAAWSAAQNAKSLIAPQTMQFATLADLYNELGHATEAASLYSPVIRAHRYDNSLWNLYNGRCWSSGLANIATKDALHDCKRAVKLSDNAPDARDSLALMLYRQGKYAEALDSYNEVLAKQPKEAWSLYMRGMTETALGQTAKGAQDRKAAIAMDPKIKQRARTYGLLPPAADGA